VNRAAIPLLVWAALLTTLAVILWVWTSDDLPPAIFSGAAGIAWLVGLYGLLRGRALARVHMAPDLSLPSALAALAIAMLVLGALIGRWLVFVGAGVLVIALAGVARELRAERRWR
jgi:hypothetical protein